MGFIALTPINLTTPGSPLVPGVFTDAHISATTDTTTGTVTLRGQGLHLALQAYDSLWHRIDMTLLDGMPGPVVERVNRLLKDLGFPKVETDWRTKKVAVLLPGKRVAVPVNVVGRLHLGVLDGPTLTVTPLMDIHTMPLSPLSGMPVAPPPEHEVYPVTPPPPAHIVVTPPAPVPVRPAISPVASVPATPLPVVTAPWERDRTVSPTPKPPAPEPVAPIVVAGPIKAERLAPVVDPSGVFTWPTEEVGIVTAPGTMEDLDKVWALHTSGRRQVVAIIGPAGTGKTSLAADLAVRHKVPVAKVDAAGAVTFADWVGFQGASEKNGATVTGWNPSGFIQAIRADNPEMGGKPRIVVIDEVNRAESSGALNALLPVCDHTGSLYIPDALRAIPIDPAVLIVFTANIGGAYTGTVSMDAALEDRVTHWVEMLFPAEDVEVDLVTSRTGLDEPQARALVRAAAQVRNIADRGEIGKGIGPRKVLQAAEKVVAGFSLLSAARSTWVLSYPNEGGTTSERNTVRSAIEAMLA